MNKDKGLLKICLRGIFLVLAISLLLSSYLKLGEPIFIDLYKDFPIVHLENYNHNDSGFYIRYISDKADNRRVSYIEFPQANDLLAYVDEVGSYSSNIVSLYEVKTLYLQFSLDQLLELEDGIVLSNAIVHFNNGDRQEVELGSIRPYRVENDKIEGKLDFQSSMGSSDGSSRIRLKAREDITIVGVENDFLEDFSHLVDLEINGIDYREIENFKIGEGEIISIDGHFKLPENLIHRLRDYDIHVNIIYKDMDNNMFTYRFRNLQSRYTSYSFRELYRYIRERGDL